MLDSRVALRIAGNKALMYRLMNDWGFDCVPRHCVCTPDDDTEARELLGAGPLVTKPCSGTGAGRGITSRIGTVRELRRAIGVAAIYDDAVLVEEHVEANSYRLLYLDGQLLDAIWRRRPSVTGNGSSTVDELVDEENSLRKQADGIRALSLITKDRELGNQLRHLGLSRRYVPDRGEVVAVKSVVNQNNALENVRVVADVHPTIAAKCAEICERAKLRFVGVDVLAPDIRNSWHAQRVIINELNTTPGLHHHVLTATGSDDHLVGRALLRHLLRD